MKTFVLTEDELHVLEVVYGQTVRVDAQTQVLGCAACRGQRRLHREDCPYRALADVIERCYREAARPPTRRGFAVLAPERQRAIAQQGGQVAHARGVAHEWTPAEARVAGQRGGTASAAQRRARAAASADDAPPSILIS